MKRFIRLNITAEGQTEERFIKQTLSDYFGHFNISTDVRCVLTSKDKHKCYRGGLISYQKARNDIVTWLKQDQNPDARFSTMFDLYALPRDFPGFEQSQKYIDPYEKVKYLEEAFQKDINDLRFFPYIQLHEFETLILSKPQELAIEYFEHTEAIETLVKLLQKAENPELINDDPESAPSKRIIKLIPEYECNKVGVGAAIAGIIGIDWLRDHCRHFANWLEKIEQR